MFGILSKKKRSYFQNKSGEETDELSLQNCGKSHVINTNHFGKKKLNNSIFSDLSTQNKKHTNFRYKSCRKSFSTYTTFWFPCPKENE